MGYITKPKIKCADCKKLTQTFGGSFNVCCLRPGKYLNSQATRYCINFESKVS